MFRSAVTKLTLWYLLIVMLISLFFSLALFSVTNNDLEQNLQHQGEQFIRFGINPFDFEQARQKALHDLQQREILNLIRFNSVVLVLAGGASYLLARRTLRPLEAAMEAQTRFTGDASHELRTPLTAMRSEIEVALREPKLSSADSRELLQSNLEEVVKLEALSRALLQLARFGSQSGELDIQELELSEILKAAVNRLEKQAIAKNISIDVAIKPIHLYGNAASLTEMFVTLIDNAIKYGKDSGEIKIVMNKTSKDASVLIQDNGIGIAETDLPFIFDRFYRADSSRSKTNAEGYGLGLALALQVAKVHHGDISVHSTPSEGSIFTVHLPLHKSNFSAFSSAYPSKFRNYFFKQ